MRHYSVGPCTVDEVGKAIGRLMLDCIRSVAAWAA